MQDELNNTTPETDDSQTVEETVVSTEVTAEDAAGSETADAPVAETPVAENVPVSEQPLTSPGMHWCVLRVASNKEDSVRDALEKKVKIEGLEGTVGRILVPTEKRPAPRSRGGAKKTVERKMYPGYVFIEMKLEEDGSIEEKAWFTIKETTGVGDFIGAGGKPAPMGLADVEKMLAQVAKAQEGAPVTVEFEKGDLVKIKEGAFENYEGEVDELLVDKGLVRVIVTIFGRATPIELEYWQIEKA